MNDVSFCTDFKCRANIAAEFDDFFLSQLFVADIVIERCEQFHADIDVPTDLTGLFNDLVVLDTYDVLDTLHRFHQLDFTDEVIHDASEIGPGGVHVQTFRAQGINFRGVGRDGDHFDCRIAFYTVVSADSLVDHTEGTFSKRLSFDLPFGPYLFQYFN